MQLRLVVLPEEVERKYSTSARFSSPPQNEKSQSYITFKDTALKLHGCKLRKILFPELRDI